MTSRLIFICFLTLFGEEEKTIHGLGESWASEAAERSALGFWTRADRGLEEARRTQGMIGQQALHFLLVIMASEEINEDYPVEIHEYLSTFENSIGAVDEMLKTMMSVSRNELLQKFIWQLKELILRSIQ
nr:nuclear nucleic acid-binding protein C1D isoform X3 [Equus asinus]